ncbi:magnesium/cobalt transporter CorA [Arvimicrobium flavum]|uniref:magnesium/cobalt transporter CorA n=1 Tax=Arvimicrobium flavum TaxID=3393320 RepID=UPI00237B6203|nr:magnesium/cobalt transporter CorA [Mesorhizobium shangrilense]
MAGSKPEGERKRPRRKAKRSPVGASPGTLVADPNARPPILSITGISPDGFEAVADASLTEVRRLCDAWPVIWLDCAGLADVGLVAEIGAIFGLHPLALEDTVNTGQRPKVDFFDDHAFVVLSMIDDVATNRYEQVAVYFNRKFVVTFQERQGDPFSPVRKRIESSQSNRLRTRSADYLAYALIDALVDSYFPALEATGDKIERIEDEMLDAPQKHQTRQMHELRRNMIAAKRALGPLHDAVAALLRSDAPYVSAETRTYINDTLDHTTRLLDMVETYRDVLTGLIDMHLSLSQAKTSEVINLLTLISTIFIPLTFLAGIWGMNFDSEASPWNMPELRADFGYPMALGLMLIIALILVLYFRWKKWL